MTNFCFSKRFSHTPSQHQYGSRYSRSSEISLRRRLFIYVGLLITIQVAAIVAIILIINTFPTIRTNKLLVILLFIFLALFLGTILPYLLGRLFSSKMVKDYVGKTD